MRIDCGHYTTEAHALGYTDIHAVERNAVRTIYSNESTSWWVVLDRTTGTYAVVQIFGWFVEVMDARYVSPRSAVRAIRQATERIYARETGRPSETILSRSGWTLQYPDCSEEDVHEFTMERGAA